MNAALRSKLRNLEQQRSTTSVKPAVVVKQRQKPPVRAPQTLSSPPLVVQKPQAKPAKAAPKKPQPTAEEKAARIAAGEAKNHAAQEAARVQRYAVLDEIIVAMRAKWPGLFGAGMPIRPLKKGIGPEVSAGLPQFSKRFVRLALSSFLYRLPVQAWYLLAVSEGGPRYGLDGQPTDEIVTEEERAAAAQQLAELEQKYPRLRRAATNA
jgi:hypothetical protein